MKRRQFLKTAAGAAVVQGLATLGLVSYATAGGETALRSPVANGDPLTPPPKGKIRVAVVLAHRATVIDFAGPWEVFQDVHVYDRGSTMNEMMPFRLYTVAATDEPIRASGGLHIIPDYTVDNAPTPHLVVVPALRGNSELHDWLRQVAPKTDVTMSVCTGAFQLAEAGLLDGLAATTHHDFYESFADDYPDVRLERDVRFVENPRISTAGGLTSGIDLALRVVARYFGDEVASQTASYMEYSGTGWQV